MVFTVNYGVPRGISALNKVFQDEEHRKALGETSMSSLGA